jgi:hypothetical protein
MCRLRELDLYREFVELHEGSIRRDLPERQRDAM